MYKLTPIGYVRSCFTDKFGVPRQPLLAPAAHASLQLLPPFDHPSAVVGLEDVSHVWLLFLFHRNSPQKNPLSVRPPRLGGNKNIGVFASRSTYRPNGIGQSVVQLEAVRPGYLSFSGVDLLDGTPIIDIKPYLPYADTVHGAYNFIAPAAPQLLSISWTPTALEQARKHADRLQEPLIALIEQCLGQDPRPAYQKNNSTRHYGFRIWDLNVTWSHPEPDGIKVMGVALYKAKLTHTSTQ